MTVTVESFRPEQLGPVEEGELWRLLVLVDEEFVPALSARESTTTKRLGGAASGVHPHTYFQKLLSQHALLAFISGRCVGFASYITNHSDEALVGFEPSCYLTTIAVEPDGRRRGVARALYEELLVTAAAVHDDAFVSTRTWSTNTSHLNLLRELGFEEVCLLKDHRGPGIHTVYLARAL